ncbi:MAG TPA: hypothetical protein VLA72_21865 [Anaerolineales bacterium]|nr:hypothetical protein [Anaerolineales bacterium]
MKEQKVYVAHFHINDEYQLVNLNDSFLVNGWTVKSITPLSEISDPNDPRIKLTRILFVIERSV